MHHVTNAEGGQSYNGKQPRNVPKVRPVTVSKSSASIFNPLAKGVGDIICTVIQCEDKVTDEICQNQLEGTKAETGEQSHFENQPKSIVKPKPTAVSNTSGRKFKPLARKAFGVKGKFKPLKR